MAVNDDTLTFQYKDYRQHGRQKHKQMTLASEEFIRRFLLHSLPPGFQRIRHYGVLASSRKKLQLTRARQLLLVMHNELAPEPALIAAALAVILQPFRTCPACHARA